MNPLESIVLIPLACIYTGPGSLLPVSNTVSLIPEYGNIVTQLMATTFANTRVEVGGILLESHFSDYTDLKEPFVQEHNSLWKV